MQFSNEIILTRNYSLYYSIIEHKKQHLSMPNLCRTNVSVIRAGARTLMGGGGLYIHIHRIISFEINFNTKETSRIRS